MGKTGSPSWRYEESSSPSDAVTHQASSIVDELMTEPGGPFVLRTPVPIYSTDIEDRARRFRRQADLVVERGELFPCLTKDRATPIPIDLDGAERLARSGWGERETASVFPQVIRSFLEETGLHISDFPAAEAEGFFRTRLTAFLARRLRTRQHPRLGDLVTSPLSKPATPESPGMRFVVRSREFGLRIHYSDAYDFDPSLVFGGSLSTPVRSWIQSGIYIFGSQARGEPGPTFELAEYEVPPAREAVLLNR